MSDVAGHVLHMVSQPRSVRHDDRGDASAPITMSGRPANPVDVAPAGWVADVTAYGRRELSGTGTRLLLPIPSCGTDWPVNGAGQSTGPASAESATGLTRFPGSLALRWRPRVTGERRRGGHGRRHGP